MASPYFLGVFTCTISKEMTDFLSTVSPLPPALLSKLTGKKMTTSNRKNSNNTYISQTVIEGVPEFGNVGIWEFNVPTTILQMGEPVKVLFTSKGENCFQVTIEAAHLGGKITNTVQFSAEGCTMKYQHESGNTFNINLNREIDIAGTYVYAKDENMKNYMAKVDTAFKIDENYKCSYELCDDTMVTVDYFKDATLPSRSKLDEETVIEYQGTKQSSFVTKTGPHSFKYILKNLLTGIVEEFDLVFTETGMVMTSKCPKKGVSYKMWLEKIIDMNGTFKLVSDHGSMKMAKLFNMDVPMIEKLLNDPNLRVINTVQGNFIRHQYKSELINVEIPCKLDEEFSFENPIMKGFVTKNVVTKHEDRLVITSKGALPGSTTELVSTQTMKFTPSFMIKTIEVPGLGFVIKAIFERVQE